ncbi:MAG: hypothetical protein C5B57_02950 [Blastocatellia bacterium]|nr:MAG: hypothetical protein C5B57_02950 [Blastocatellia bacterium]
MGSVVWSRVQTKFHERADDLAARRQHGGPVDYPVSSHENRNKFRFADQSVSKTGASIRR